MCEAASRENLLAALDETLKALAERAEIPIEILRGTYDEQYRRLVESA